MNWAFVKDGNPMKFAYHKKDRDYFAILVNSDDGLIKEYEEEVSSTFDFLLFHG